MGPTRPARNAKEPRAGMPRARRYASSSVASQIVAALIHDGLAPPPQSLPQAIATAPANQSLSKVSCRRLRDGAALLRVSRPATVQRGDASQWLASLPQKLLAAVRERFSQETLRTWSTKMMPEIPCPYGNGNFERITSGAACTWTNKYKDQTVHCIPAVSAQ